mmetsp:Transcript_34745/g.50927  ORF Transcript_34745/g.50927 Transcript_34745/m.50927 type:complete len:554 (+) Transcript_34745:607-2268(+)
MRYGAEQFGYTFVTTNDNEQQQGAELSTTTTTETSKLVNPSSTADLNINPTLVESAAAGGTTTSVHNTDDYQLMSTTPTAVPSDEEDEEQQQHFLYNPPPAKHDNNEWSTNKEDNGGAEQIPAVLSAFGACCCCITAAFVLAGGILVAYGSYQNNRQEKEDGDRNQLIGSILLVVSASTCLLGWCSCCFSCVSTAVVDVAAGGATLPPSGDQKRIKLKFRRLNDEFQGAQDALNHVHFDVAGDMKEIQTAKKKEHKNKEEEEKQQKKLLEQHIQTDLKRGTLSVSDIRRKYRPIAFYIKFDGDLLVSTLDLLTKQVSTIVNVGKANIDQVIVVLSSPGGSVSSYGLASSQLVRIRKAGIKLVICVDTVAASGGYMMASVGDVVCAAPFAMIGSIGVVTQIPNFHRFLDKNSIDAFLFTAGKHKRTVDVIGEVTDEGKEKLQEELDDIHRAFKDHVALARPKLKDAIEDVGTGEYWLAVQAKELGLVDVIMTSDEYLESIRLQYDIIEIAEKKKKSGILSALHQLDGMKGVMGLFSSWTGQGGQQHQPMPMAVV